LLSYNTASWEKNNLKKRRQMRLSDSLALAAQRYTNCWLWTNGLTLLLFLLSHGLSTFKPHYLWESAPDVLPKRSNLPTRHQLLSDQLRSGQASPSDIAVPPGPGGRYRSMNTTFQRSNEQAPVYELPPIHTLATTVQKIFQTWTCSPAQVLTRSLILSSSTKRKQFRMIVVRDTHNTFCFPFLLTCSICSC
jgi:hypothetical protein